MPVYLYPVEGGTYGQGEGTFEAEMKIPSGRAEALAELDFRLYPWGTGG